jgi:hypothetical protein
MSDFTIEAPVGGESHSPSRQASHLGLMSREPREDRGAHLFVQSLGGMKEG